VVPNHAVHPLAKPAVPVLILMSFSARLVHDEVAASSIDYLAFAVLTPGISYRVNSDPH
jgi:hypothetical protein